MSEVLVSIIIPTYNVERYVEECLDSVLAQSYQQIEIIVIDDGSTDTTPYLLKPYDDKVNITLNEKNAGQGAVRNQGIKQARGKYILFVDADDWIDSETVKIVLEKAEKIEADLVRFNGQTFSEGSAAPLKQNLYQFNAVLDEKTIYTDGGLLDANRKSFSASPCLYLIKKTVLEENAISFPEGIIHEDEYFTIKLFVSIKNMTYVNQSLYNRRYRVASTMTENAPAHKKNSFKSYLEIFKLVDQLYQSDQYNEEQKIFLKRQLISIYNGLQESDVSSAQKKELHHLSTITLKDRLHIKVSKVRRWINEKRK